MQIPILPVINQLVRDLLQVDCYKVRCFRDDIDQFVPLVHALLYGVYPKFGYSCDSLLSHAKSLLQLAGLCPDCCQPST